MIPPIAPTAAVQKSHSTRSSPAVVRLAREIRGAGGGGRLLGGTEGTRNAERGTRNAKAKAAARVIFNAVGVLVEVGSGKTGAECRVPSGASKAPMRGRGNATVYLAAWPPADHPQALELTRPTPDKFDQAHGERFPEGHPEAGLLVPATRAGQAARPRRYPECHFNGRGVAIDSSFDELYERLKWMERELGGVAGMSVSSVSSSLGASIEQAARKAGSGRRLRSQIEGKRRAE